MPGLVASVTLIALVTTSVATLMSAYRVLFGPTVPDRAVGADTVATGGICLILLAAIRSGSLASVDVVIVLAVLSFLGTVALAKYIAKGVIIERDGDS